MKATRLRLIGSWLLAPAILIAHSVLAWGSDPSPAECKEFRDKALAYFKAQTPNPERLALYDREVEKSKQVIMGIFKAIESRGNLAALDSEGVFYKAIAAQVTEAKASQDWVNCDTGTFSQGHPHLSDSSVRCSSPPASFQKLWFELYSPVRLCLSGTPNELAGQVDRSSFFYKVCFSMGRPYFNELGLSVFDPTSSEYYQNGPKFSDSSQVLGIKPGQRAQYANQDIFVENYLRERSCPINAEPLASSLPSQAPTVSPDSASGGAKAPAAAKAAPSVQSALILPSSPPRVFERADSRDTFNKESLALYADAVKDLEEDLSKIKTVSKKSPDPLACAALCVDFSQPTVRVRSVIKTGHKMGALLANLKTACKKTETIFPRGSSLISPMFSKVDILTRGNSCFEREILRVKDKPDVAAPDEVVCVKPAVEALDPANKSNVVQLKEVLSPEKTPLEGDAQPSSHIYELPPTDNVGAIAVKDEFVFTRDYEMSCNGERLKSYFGSVRALFMPIYCKDHDAKITIPQGTRFKVTGWEKVSGDLPYRYSLSITVPKDASSEAQTLSGGLFESKSDVNVGEFEKMLENSFRIRSLR